MTQGLNLPAFYDSEKRVFEYGEIPANMMVVTDNKSLTSSKYNVSK